MKVQFRLHARKAGQWLPEPYNANMSWELDVLPRKGERVKLSGWMFDVVNIEHRVYYVGGKLRSDSIVYLKAH